MGSNSENCIQENKQTHQNQITRVFGKELTNNHIPINNPSDYLSKKSSRSYSMCLNPLTQNFIEETKHSEPMIIEEETPSLEMADLSQINNPSFVSHYAKDIFEFCKANEARNQICSDYMQNQQDINDKMRSILIDWLIDVHLKFKLRDETLFLTINLIDRFLEKNMVLRQKLQLVGVCTMLIACKYEEIYSPEVKDFVYITDNAYSKEEVLEMEGKILTTIGFNLFTHSSLLFLQRYMHLSQAEERICMLARYILELSLIEYKMIKFSPLIVSSSCLYLAFKLFKIPTLKWHQQLLESVPYTESEIRGCAKELCVLLQNSEKNQLQAVRRKFSNPKFMSIAKSQFAVKK